MDVTAPGRGTLTSTTCGARLSSSVSPQEPLPLIARSPAWSSRMGPPPSRESAGHAPTHGSAPLQLSVTTRVGWWAHQESNLGPLPCQGRPLPRRRTSVRSELHSKGTLGKRLQGSATHAGLRAAVRALPTNGLREAYDCLDGRGGGSQGDWMALRRLAMRAPVGAGSVLLVEGRKVGMRRLRSSWVVVARRRVGATALRGGPGRDLRRAVG